MLLTLFTDASFCDTTRAAGWGAWAKREDWKYGRTLGDAFKRPMQHCSEAELCAIVSALHKLQGQGELVGIHAVLVQADSMRALGLVLSRVTNARAHNHPTVLPVLPIGDTALSRNEGTALDKLDHMVKHYRWTLLLKHVKGHQKGPGRPWVNRTCDALARKHMSAKRKLLRGAVP